jgi:hypothetical protein
MKILLLAFIFLSGCVFPETKKICNQHEGIQALHRCEESHTYELLKNCSSNADVSGEVLQNLHSLILLEGFGDYQTAEERYKHSQQLLCAAALKGYSPSISVLASYYERGEKSLNINTDREISSCLYGLQRNNLMYVKPTDVATCLSLNSSINPTYQCYNLP